MLNSSLSRMAALALTVSVFVLVRPAAAKADPPPKTLRLVREVGLRADLAGRWGALAVDSRRHRLFLTTLKGNGVYVVEAETGTLVKRIESPPAAVPVYESADDRLTIFSAGIRTTYDARTYQRTAIAAFAPGVEAAGYDASLGTIYVTAVVNGSAQLMAFDRPALAQGFSLPLGGGRLDAMALDASRARIYIADRRENRIIVVDRWTRDVARSWPVEIGADIGALALDEQHQRLYVACARGGVEALDSNTGREVETVPLPAGTNGLAFDPDAQRLYALGHAKLRIYERADAAASVANRVRQPHFPVDAPFAESLVRSTLSAYPDLRKMGLHAVPPGGHVSVIIANGNAQRIGIPTTPGDFAATASGSTYGPKIGGLYYNMKLAMFDASGTRFGLLVMEIPVTWAVDETDAARIAERIRHRMAARIKSASALFAK